MRSSYNLKAFKFFKVTFFKNVSFYFFLLLYFLYKYFLTLMTLYDYWLHISDVVSYIGERRVPRCWHGWPLRKDARPNNIPATAL